MYVRRTLAGEFVCVSRHLLSDLIARGIWTPELKNKLIAHNGSVQRIDEVPKDLKDLYKTVWEISQRDIINMAADRGCYIDQSQSLNIHINDPTYGKLTSMHFHGWESGLKTGMYYLRSKPAVDAIKFTVDQGMLRMEDRKNKSVEDSQSSSSSSATLTPVALALQTSTRAKASAAAFKGEYKMTEFSWPLSSPTLSASLQDAMRSPSTFTLPKGTLHIGRSISTESTDSISDPMSSPASSSPGTLPHTFSAELAGSSKSAIASTATDSKTVGVMLGNSNLAPTMIGGQAVSTADIAEANRIRAEREKQKEEMYCSIDNKAGCISCSS